MWMVSVAVVDLILLTVEELTFVDVGLAVVMWRVSIAVVAVFS